MQPVVYKQIPRCTPELLDQIASFPVADLHESLGAIEGRLRLMSPRMRLSVPRKRRSARR